MFPSEMAILMALAATSDSGKKLLTRPMDVVGIYIGYLYDSLVRRGYLKKDGSRDYQLTSKGKGALAEFLYANKTKVKDTIKTLQQLGIEISQDVDRLEEGVIKVR
ncbi:hypothetical protein ACFLX8_04780 [Chloroflexota bacterium]